MTSATGKLPICKDSDCFLRLPRTVALTIRSKDALWLCYWNGTCVVRNKNTHITIYVFVCGIRCDESTQVSGTCISRTILNVFKSFSTNRLKKKMKKIANGISSNKQPQRANQCLWLHHHHFRFLVCVVTAREISSPSCWERRDRGRDWKERDSEPPKPEPIDLLTHSQTNKPITK